MFTNGQIPCFFAAAPKAAIGAFASPAALYGTSGSRVSRFFTRSRAQNMPTPRTSPTLGCRSASSRSAGSTTEAPSRAAFSTTPSSAITLIVATAAAQASGCPEYVRPPG